MSYTRERLSSLCDEVVVGHVGSSSGHRHEAGVPFLMGKNIGEGFLKLEDLERVTPEFHRAQKKSQLQPGDVVVVRIGKSGLAARIPESLGEANCSGLVVIKRPTKVTADYLVHFLNSPEGRRQSLDETKGSTRQTLNTKSIAAAEIPVPPLEVQLRITRILDKVDALRAKRRAALARLDTLTQSIFLDMFGDPATNPKGWQKRPFGEVCESRLGKMLDQKRQTGKHRRPYLRNANVQWFWFDLADVFLMDFDEDDRKSLRLRPGDLLICEGGEPGRAAVWGGEMEECYFQKALHRARPDRRLATSEYLAWLLWFLAQRGSLSGVTSATIAHLTGEKLALLPTMLPPLDVQDKFTRRAKAVKQLGTIHGDALAKLDALFSSVQHRAFGGEL